MTKPLTPLQRRFVEEYVSDSNASAAARRAGSKARNSRQAGHELLANPVVKEAIGKRLEQQVDERKGIRDLILSTLTAIVEADLADIVDNDMQLRPIDQWPDEWRASVPLGFKVSAQKRTLSIATPHRLTALKLLAEMIGALPTAKGRKRGNQLDDLAERVARAKSRQPSKCPHCGKGL